MDDEKKVKVEIDFNVQGQMIDETIRKVREQSDRSVNIFVHAN
jgi:hypothetical protein